MEEGEEEEPIWRGLLRLLRDAVIERVKGREKRERVMPTQGFFLLFFASLDLPL